MSLVHSSISLVYYIARHRYVIGALEHQLGILHIAAQVGDWLGMIILSIHVIVTFVFVLSCPIQESANVVSAAREETKRLERSATIDRKRLEAKVESLEKEVFGLFVLLSIFFVCLREIIIPH